MFTKQTIRDVDVQNKIVLLRADYNVPIDAGKITDDYRVKQSLETIHYLLERNVKLIICSHLGRPTGSNDVSCSLSPVAKRLEHLLEKPVLFASDCIGKPVEKAVQELQNGQVLLLENLRYHPEEEANDDAFAAELAKPAELFVQDGFGVVHRAHASTSAITKHLPSVAGLLLEKEVDTITNVMLKPKKPLMAIVGGAKIADKIEILNRFIEIADFVAIGGAMANTFLAARGIDIADSLFSKEDIPLAKDIMRKASVETVKRQFIFSIPYDGVAAHAIDKTQPTRIVGWSEHSFADIENYPKKPPVSATQIQEHEKIVDIGPFSGSFIAGAVQLSNTVVWNGTMGVTETPSLQGPIGPYAHGTELVIEALLGDFGHKPFTVVGGGDTVGYLGSRNLMDSFGHVSTGGGAGLELMAGRKLPGVEALMDKS
jgi:3-phosphoglycerate kinase